MKKITININCSDKLCGCCGYEQTTKTSVLVSKCIIFDKILNNENDESMRCEECIDAEGLKPVVQIIAPKSVEVKVE